MKSFKTVVLAFAALSPIAFAQQLWFRPVVSHDGFNSVVARVYVSSSPSPSTTQIFGYTADADGKLQAVPGSPFPENGTTLAATQKYLFSSDTVNIYSFSIAANGALEQVSTIDAQAYNGYADGGPISLFLDRSGSTLYDLDIYGNIGANNTYQYFDVDKSTGALSYLGATSVATPDFETSLSFVPGNKYGYGAGCYHGDQALYGFSRTASGTLDYLNLNPPYPAAQNGEYCPGPVAADDQHHLAVALSPNNDYTPTGPTQLGVYTATVSGSLITSSTYENMPAVAVNNVYSMSISPSSKLLAVGGTGGVQVFNFNGAGAVTPYTGLLTTDEISQVAWDNDNHLYAVSQTSGELFVFTVTPSAYQQEAGSPYAIAGAANLVVLPSR